MVVKKLLSGKGNKIKTKKTIFYFINKKGRDNNNNNGILSLIWILNNDTLHCERKEEK